ncbi:MAG: T9SS type A sorting domain-containing protein [Flavobacteriales bacterium]|nr:T9SS type A sorting domain-containing protein [Flavobacteriales bacterium]
MWSKLFLTVIAFIPGVILAQGQHHLLESMSVRQIDDGVRIDFGIKGGASCTGAQMQRRLGESDYVQVGQIQGVCGGSEFTEFYTILDSSPINNQEAHYRLILGNQGPTTELSITFIPMTGEVLMYPNPTNGPSRVRWSGVDGDVYILRVMDASGHLMHEEQVIAPSANANFQDLRPGFYILQLIKEGEEPMSYRFLRQ